MVGGVSGAHRAAPPAPAARWHGAELGAHRRSAGLGPGHGYLHAGAESFVAVLLRSQLPRRRAAARGGRADPGRLRATEHEPVRCRDPLVAGRAAHGLGTLVPDQHDAAERRDAHRRWYGPARGGGHDPRDLGRDGMAPAHNGQPGPGVLSPRLRGAGRTDLQCRRGAAVALARRHGHGPLERRSASQSTRVA